MQSNRGGENWDLLSGVYDSLYQGAWSRREDEQTKEQVFHLVGKLSKIEVLDIGCGTGIGHKFLTECGREFRYIGVDSSVGMLRCFRRNYPDARTVLADANDLASMFRPERFDLILGLNAVMSYCGNLTTLLRSIHTVTRPGGWIFLSYLNKHSLRRCVHGKFGDLENFLTRGAKANLGVEPAIVVSHQELDQALSAIGFSETDIYTQSVLGGVWETALSAKVEKYAHQFFPRLGHTINVIARRH